MYLQFFFGLFIIIWPIIIYNCLNYKKVSKENILISILLVYIIYLILGTIIFFGIIPNLIVIVSFYSILLLLTFILIYKFIKNQTQNKFFKNINFSFSFLIFLPIIALCFYKTNPILPISENFDFSYFSSDRINYNQTDFLMKFDKIVLILYLILILFVFLIFLYEKNTLYKSSTILFSLMILLIDPIIRTGRPWGIDSYTFLAQISGFLNQTFPLDYVLVVPQTQYMIIGFFLYTISFSSILEFGMIVLPIVNCSIFIIYFLRLKEELPFNIKIFLLLLIFSPLLLQIQRINSAQTIGLFFFIVSIYFEKYQDKVTKNWSFLFGICTSIHNLTALIYLSYLLIKPVFEEKNTYPKQFFLFNSITIVIILFILEITQFFTVVLNPTILTNNIFYDLLDGPVLYYSPVYAVIKIKLRILLIFILIFSFIFSLFLNQHKGYHIQKISRNKWFQTIKMTYNKNITNIQTLINERIYLTTILLSLTIVSTSFFILIYVLNYKFGMSVFYVFIFYLNYLSVLLLLIYFILKKEIRFDFFIIVISIIIPFFMFLFGSNTLKWFSSLFIRPIYLVIASTIFAIPFEFKKELFYKKNSKKTPIFTFLSISLGFLGSFLFAA